MSEQWRSVRFLEVSDEGRVRHRGRILAAHPIPKGYMMVKPQIDKVRHTFYVHRLVAEAFIGPPPTPAHEVDHLNRDPGDNRSQNLEWVTSSENKIRAGIRPPRRAGTANGRSLFTPRSVRAIRAALRIGVSPTAIARTVGCSVGAIRAIKDRRNWKRT
jgi:hypothetical protein